MLPKLILIATSPITFTLNLICCELSINITYENSVYIYIYMDTACTSNALKRQCVRNLQLIPGNDLEIII